MKVGLLTFYKGINHGAILQANAIYTVFKEKGYDVEFIAYRNKTHFFQELISAFFTYRVNKFYNNSIKLFLLNKFTKKYFKESKRVFSIKGFKKLKYDCIVVGSDIVWNFNKPRWRYDPVYFGFHSENTKLIAYAPSIGDSTTSEEILPAEIKIGISKFESIGARDYSTQKFVAELIGNEIPMVLDPTFLVPLDHLKGECKYSKYILIYAFSKFNSIQIKEIQQLCKNEGLTTISVGYTQKWCDINKAFVGIEDWLEFFRNAEYIITSTFHGTLFSIINNKQFCTIGNEKINCKLDYIVPLLELQNRIITQSDSIVKLLHDPIDYDKVNVTLDINRKKSLDYLFDKIKNENR